jgi:protein TonB
MVEPLVAAKPSSSANAPSAGPDSGRSSRQFTHFGVMNTGRQGSGAFATSLFANVVLAALLILINASLVKMEQQYKERKVISLTLPVAKPPEPIKPPPKPLSKPPVLKMEEPPKITVPVAKLPDVLQPVTVKMPQQPVIVPPPPKAITAPAAPQPVNLARPQAASLPNNNPHPTAVALGRPDSPIPTNTNKPAVSSVDLGQKGVPGMTASNTGAGPAATKVNLGSGQPDSQAMKGNGPSKVLGIRLGTPGGTGPPNGSGQQIGQVNLGQVQTPAMPKPAEAKPVAAEHAPKVLFKPTPVYTAEAAAQHITGDVTLRIRVSATGTVTVLQMVNGLGHGLDESARNAIMATKFSPATDASGHPTDWEGLVRVNFQLSGA